MFRPIEQDAKIRIITRKDPEALELIRHDMAHILAMAVQELYPGTQVTIGPAIEDGFYYDFARDEPFTPEDLPKIEDEDARDHQGGPADPPRGVAARQGGRAFQGHRRALQGRTDRSAFRRTRMSRSIGTATGTISAAGRIFAPPRKIGDAFKLTKIAGAYWRGDAKNAQLQRIYGTAWRDKKELDAYLAPAGGSREARPPQARHASWSCSPSRPTSALACRCGCPTAW